MMSRFQFKILAAMLLVALVPSVAAMFLVGQVIRITDSVAEGQAERLMRPLQLSAGAYRRLFESLKQGFNLEAQLLANDVAITLRTVLKNENRTVFTDAEKRAIQKNLMGLQQSHSSLAQIVIEGDGGNALVVSERSSKFHEQEHRDLDVTVPITNSVLKLRCTFFTSREPFEEFKTLGIESHRSRAIAVLRSELSSYSWWVFLAMLGFSLVGAGVMGLVIARQTSRQVLMLARATKRVAAGDLHTQVSVKSRDEVGELTHAFNDMVTELRQNREQIGYLEKIGAWQEVARRLAHEIKNPLTPIQLAVQQLQKTYRGDDARFRAMLDESTEIVTEEVEGLRRLVQAFSSFAKLPTIAVAPVDINAVVDDFLKSHVELAQRVDIQWTPLPEARIVLADRMMIKHVLFNLVENAIHAYASQRGGTASESDRNVVQLRAEMIADRTQLQMSVIDYGPGMTDEVAAKVFEPYFTQKEHGTGLGLAIVKKIILEHKGTITVQSKVGEGSTFSFTLPSASTDEAIFGLRPRKLLTVAN